MKRSSLTCCAVLALLACAEQTPSPSADKLVTATQDSWRVAPQSGLNDFFNCLKNEGVSLVSAHRGGPTPGFPENAIETMAHILTAAPAIMEIDVATSADGILYLMHDDTLGRTTTGSGDADRLSWSNLKTLNLEDNDGQRTDFAPSRFDDALAWAKERTVLQVDFKQSTAYEDVTKEIYRQGAEDRVILIAYSMASARKLHRLAPEVMISLSVGSQSELNRAVAAGIPADRLIGFTGTQSPRPRLFSLLDDREIEVIFGTLGGRNSIDREIAATGDEDRYGDLAAQGVDIIATDRPIQAHHALDIAGRAPSGTTSICGISPPADGR